MRRPKGDVGFESAGCNDSSAQARQECAIFKTVVGLDSAGPLCLVDTTGSASERMVRLEG